MNRVTSDLLMTACDFLITMSTAFFWLTHTRREKPQVCVYHQMAQVLVGKLTLVSVSWRVSKAYVQYGRHFITFQSSRYAFICCLKRRWLTITTIQQVLVFQPLFTVSEWPTTKCKLKSELSRLNTDVKIPGSNSEFLQKRLNLLNHYKMAFSKRIYEKWQTGSRCCFGWWVRWAQGMMY